MKVIKNKASLRNCRSQEEPQKTRQLKVLQCVGWGPGTETGIPGKNYNQNEAWGTADNNVSTVDANCGQCTLLPGETECGV